MRETPQQIPGGGRRLSLLPSSSTATISPSSPSLSLLPPPAAPLPRALWVARHRSPLTLLLLTLLILLQIATRDAQARVIPPVVEQEASGYASPILSPTPASSSSLPPSPSVAPSPPSPPSARLTLHSLRAAESDRIRESALQGASSLLDGADAEGWSSYLSHSGAWMEKLALWAFPPANKEEEQQQQATATHWANASADTKQCERVTFQQEGATEEEDEGQEPEVAASMASLLSSSLRSSMRRQLQSTDEATPSIAARTGTSEASDPLSAPIPVPLRTPSKFSTMPNPKDHAPPSTLPTAPLIVPLTPLGDGTHWVATLLLGRSNSSGFDLPDSSSIPVKLVVDTGIADILIWNKTSCAGVFSTNKECGNYVNSESMRAAPLPSYSFGVSLDGESYMTPNGRIVEDLLTLPMRISGTSQREYSLFRLPLYLSDNTIRATPANYQNWDANGWWTTTMVNQNYYDLADGVLGLGFPSHSRLAALYNTAYTPYQHLAGSHATLFSLDFEAHTMAIGGIEETYRSRLVWSGAASVPLVSGYHSFTLSHLKVCGLDMFANLTSTPSTAAASTVPPRSWHAIIDSGSSCLGLPAELFDMVLSWLPLHCKLGRMDGLPHICYITDDVKPILPTLSFTLAEGGTELFISLSELLYTSYGPVPLDGQAQPRLRRICLYRGSSMRNGPDQYNSIVFGGRVLRQFYLAFDMSVPSRVGFAQKQDIKESQLQCSSRVVCSGMQVHDAALNLCMPPSCGDYIFFSYDENKKECVLSGGFHAVVSLLLILFLSFELGLNELVLRLTKRVQETAIQVGDA